MATEWEIEKRTGRCRKCEKELAPEEEFIACLAEDGSTFSRIDYCMNCWEAEKPEVFSFWRTQMPEPHHKKKLIADEGLVVRFFQRLGDESEESRLRLRFMIALLLMRRRILKYEGTEKQDGREAWKMRFAGQWADVAGESHATVVNPGMNRAEAEEVSNHLRAILSGEIDEADLEVLEREE
jgi:hypothetical protein